MTRPAIRRSSPSARDVTPSPTYCSRECQAEDWPRHKENCVPVMVKEYEGKGRGLVAAKDIKMGELILTNEAVITDKDFIHNGYFLTAEAERLLINQKILKDISLLNHSCAPKMLKWDYLTERRTKNLRKDLS